MASLDIYIEVRVGVKGPIKELQGGRPSDEGPRNGLDSSEFVQFCVVEERQKNFVDVEHSDLVGIDNSKRVAASFRKVKEVLNAETGEDEIIGCSGAVRYVLVMEKLAF
jgi:hypothetical protein